MNELIALLIAIKEFAKDIHYNVKGLTAIENHKFADEIFDGIDDFIDEIKEVCLLGVNLRPLTSKEYMQRALLLIPDLPEDDKKKFEVMQELIDRALNIIEDMDELNHANNSVIDKIAEHLQKYKGLINLILE